MIKIRKATLKDCKVCYEMGKAKELVGPDHNPPRYFWISAFVKEKQPFFVAEENNKIIGFVFAEQTTGQVMLLQEMFVIKEYRGKGIASRLLKEIEDESKKRKLRVILLYGYAKGKSASSFWDNHGYTKGSLEYEYVKFLRQDK